MKILILALLLVGCSTPPITRDDSTYREKISKNIENCMVRMADRGVEEKLLYILCSKAHRPTKTQKARGRR